ncbi:putative P4-family integrase [Rhodobacterales bacterium HTCC2654]|uniref:Putative P4-family integrase n=1 Tax=Maritimibacter alkaliphilus HTCC2654 TaxID=314271 RepID=A3VKJ4_9RHOB|nr:putative P4-family integrase [Rhodobacterales bacterium HTCC2654] [Maritimibacter alkaliphilus HTCC2654]
MERDALKAKGEVPTFTQAIPGALEKYGPEMASERYRKQWVASLELYAVPVFGETKVDEVTVDDVFAALQPIWLEKTDTARRVRGRIEKVLLWAKGQGFVKGENPARWGGNLELRLSKPSSVAKVIHQPALALTDLADWFSDLKSRKGNAARALELAALTAARSGEVRGMKWGEIDFEHRLWIVPAARMKMDREHRVPLSNAATELLKGLERGSDDDFVFAAPRGGALSDMALSQIMKRMHFAALKVNGKGYVDRVSGRPAVPHGLRSAFRDWVAECTSYPGEMAEVALAHKVSNSVEAAYRRGDQLEKRRQMMSAWAAFLTGSQDQKIIGFEVSRG